MLAASAQEDVAGLDVAVHDAGTVGVLEAGEHLRDQVDPGPGRRRTARAQPLQQVAVGDQLGDEVEAPVQLAVVVDRDHVRGVHPRQRHRLALEAFPVLRVAGELGVMILARPRGQRGVAGAYATPIPPWPSWRGRW